MSLIDPHSDQSDLAEAAGRGFFLAKNRMPDFTEVLMFAQAVDATLTPHGNDEAIANMACWCYEVVYNDAGEHAAFTIDDPDIIVSMSHIIGDYLAATADADNTVHRVHLVIGFPRTALTTRSHTILLNLSADSSADDHLIEPGHIEDAVGAIRYADLITIRDELDAQTPGA